MIEFLILLAIVALVLRCMIALKGTRRRASIIRKVRCAVDQHVETLAKKRFQLVQVDDYGLVQDEKWKKEILYFFNKVVAPKLNDSDVMLLAADSSEVNQLIETEIENRIRPLTERLKRNLEFNENMSPIDFEHYVGALFSRQGWNVQVSQASGDQGADVIAKKGGQSIAVQCKLYSKPVGNKAVQEVIAARQYYKTNMAMVITNNVYTPSARKLAGTSEVQLLHFSEVKGALSGFS